MVRDTLTRRMLLCETLGFLAVIAFLWANELFDLPNLMFGTGPTPVNWTECLTESVLVAFLGFLVLVSSELLLGRVRYLEGFLPVCRHCEKIRVGDEWMSFDAYKTKYWQEAISGGSCPDCSKRMRAIEASVRPGKGKTGD